MGKSRGMVDVSCKDVTVRTARGVSTIILGDEAYRTLVEGSCNKGDVFATAKVAAVQGVKSTESIIPLCHTILIESVDVEFEMDEAGRSVTTSVTVKSSGKTGVEMEALTGASVGALTIYDMLKYTGKGMVISEVKLMEKTGGKSGDYKR